MQQVTLDGLVEEVREEVVGWRRRLHRNPELSFHEEETSRFVYETLRSFGNLELSRPTPTSVVARLVGERPEHTPGHTPGRVLAVRADMDALPITEENDFEFASRNPGVMHACGHDGHTAMLLMVSATVLSKNVYRVFAPSAGERRVGNLAKILVPLVALVALYFTLNSGKTIVLLLLLGYSLVTQLFPALVCSLLPNNFVTKWGAAAGIIAGVATVTYVTATGKTIGDLLSFLPGSAADINVGIVALVINALVLVVVSLATRGLAAREQPA